MWRHRVDSFLRGVLWRFDPLTPSDLVPFTAPDAPNRPRVVSQNTNMEVHNHEGAIALRSVIGAKATRSNIAIVAIRMVRVPDFDDIVPDAPFGTSSVGAGTCVGMCPNVSACRRD